MYIEHELIRPGAIEHRDYQSNIAESCLSRSTLVVLPTGLGKTIIALQVIASVLKDKGPKILFMAPTKPLVEQHAAFLRNNLLNENITVFTGEVGSAKRGKMWNENDIIVSTPQVIVNDILGSKISMEDVKLVVFDEAHRAVGDYAYVFIGKRCSELGTLVMGMTASPGSQPEHIIEVCGNLGIEGVEIRTEYDPDVVSYVHDIEVNWKRVELPEEMKVLSKELKGAMDEQVKELQRFGFLEGKKFATTKDILLVGQEIRKKLRTGKSPSLFTAATVQALALKINHSIELLETQGPAALRNYFERLEEEANSKGSSRASRQVVKNPRMIKAKAMAAHASYDHPKLKVAIDVIGDQLKYNPDSRIILFTHFRDTAELAAREVGKIAGARSLRFVGQASRGRDKGLKQKEQVEAIAKFSSGERNVLVATSVAEEGLDIPSTDLVVFYEPIPSEIRTIQRRGRTGRRKAGKVVILMAKDSRDEAYYWASRSKEKRMHKELENLRSRLKDKIEVGAPRGEAFRSALETGLSDEGQSGGKVLGKDQKTIFDFKDTDEDKVQVLVDSRELVSKVVKELYAEGIIVKTARLEVADYVLSERVAVERKEVEDFIRSIIDGRLFQQAIEMSKEYQSPIMVIEGEDLFERTAMHEKAIFGALASLLADFHLPIIFTKNEVETARILTAIAKREHKEGKRIVGIRGEKGSMSLQDRQRFIVESLPNVSGTLASRLLAHFGTVRNVVNADVEELTKVKGVGKATAEKIRKVLDGQYYLAEKEEGRGKEQEEEQD
jgi:Fanconi anemia group M protein